MKRTKQRSFTLIELMTVLMVVLVLAGITFTLVPLANRQAGDYKTSALITGIENALESYNALFGYYPPSFPPANYSKSAKEVQYQPFFLDKTDSNEFTVNKTMRQFFGSDQLAGQTRLEAIAGLEYIIDAYNNPIIYRCPGRFNTTQFDLISLGADGKAGDGAASAVYAGSVVVSGVTQSFTAIDNDKSVTDYFGEGDDLTNYKK